MCHFCRSEDIEYYRLIAERAEKEKGRLIVVVIALMILLIVSIAIIAYMIYDNSQYDYIYYNQDTVTGDNKIIISKDGVNYANAERGNQD